MIRYCRPGAIFGAKNRWVFPEKKFQNSELVFLLFVYRVVFHYVIQILLSYKNYFSIIFMKHEFVVKKVIYGKKVHAYLYVFYFFDIKMKHNENVYTNIKILY